MRRLSSLIAGSGAPRCTGRPASSYVPQFPRLRDADDALLLARDLEERLVRAHLDALMKLPAGDSAGRWPASPPARRSTWPWWTGWAAGRAPQAFVTGTS